MTSFKLPKSVKSLTESKMALYILVGLSLVNVLAYMMNGCLYSVIFFMLVGCITCSFNKNMVVCLASALFFTTIFTACKIGTEPVAHNHHHYREGMEDKGGEDNMGGQVGETNKGSGDGNEKTKSHSCKTHEEWDKKDNKCVPKAANDTTGDKDSKESAKPKSAFTGYKNDNNRVDYAATVEEAYDDLGKILGGDGLKSLTSDTQTLVKQQKELASAMKGMGPLVQQAAGMMDQLGGKNGLSKMLGGLNSMTRDLPGSKVPAN
jgi:hypothetical protein